MKAKRILSMALVLCLCLTMLPAMAMQAEAATTNLMDMQSRAEAIVNYTWVPSSNISTWNGNTYNGKTYFPQGQTVKGVPYTLFTSEVVSWSLCSLSQYKSVASSNYSAIKYCTSVGATRTGPVYGSCCADLVCEVFGGSFMNGESPRYHNVSAIQNSSYATTKYNVKAADIVAGDALSDVGKNHIIWIGEVTTSHFTIYEQTPPVARKTTISKNSINSSGHLVYGGLVYSTVTKSNEFIGTAPEKPTITTTTAYYAEGRDVSISWNAVAGNSYYWINLYKDGNLIVNQSMDNQTTYTMKNVSKGEYTFAVSANNSIGTSGGSQHSFLVGIKPEKPEVFIAKTFYKAGETVNVSWESVLGNTFYWVSVYRDGDLIINQTAENFPSFSMQPDLKGMYEILVSSNNGAGTSGVTKCSFLVDAVPQKPEIRNEVRRYDVGDSVVVEWSEVVGNVYYWISIYKDDELIINQTVDNHTSYTILSAEEGGYMVYVSSNNSAGTSGSDSYGFVVGNPKYTIYYDANGGADAPPSQIKTHGKALTLSSITPTREGHTFAGWATSSTANNATYQPGGNFTIDADTMLYAVWNQLYLGTVDNWNVTLEDNLKVNFHVRISDSIVNEASIRVIVSDKVYTYYPKDLTQTEDDCYLISIKIAAAQMKDSIIIMGMKNGQVGSVSSYTVWQYCDTILADETHSEYHTLVKKMLNYGAMAQEYFAYNTENPANSGMSDAAAVEVPETVTEMAVTDKLSGLSFYGASLVYRDRIAVRYYLTGDVTGLTFTANGKAYTPVPKDGMYYIEIADILPQNLDEQITLNVTDANGDNLSVTYSPMNYIVRMNAKGNEKLKNLLKALYNYHLAAKAL